MTLYRGILFTTAGLLFLATLAAVSLPYAFFIFLRVLVCGVALYTACRSANAPISLVGLLMVAALFNPVVLIHLPQTTWRIIDLAVAATFIRLALNPAKSPGA